MKYKRRTICNQIENLFKRYCLFMVLHNVQILMNILTGKQSKALV